MWDKVGRYIMQTIENSLLQVSVDENDACLAHIISKQGDIDYLADGTKQEKTAVIFPAAGDEDNLALKLPWTVVDKGDARVSLTLIDTPSSYKKYPYHFELMVTYSLEGNQLKINFHVKNNSNKAMPFSLNYRVPLLSKIVEESVTRIILAASDKKVTFESTDFKMQVEQDGLSCMLEKAELAGEAEQDYALSFTFE